MGQTKLMFSFKLDGVGPVDMWGEMNLLSKCQLPRSCSLFKIFNRPGVAGAVL